MQKAWWEEYLGKPWASVPKPPQSFTCGDLARYILKDRLGVDTVPVYADPAILRQCVDNLDRPELYNLEPATAPLRPFDLAFMTRVRRHNHLGIAVQTTEGLMILHCQRGSGVVLDSSVELLSIGYRRISWFRHREVSEEMAVCRA
jgi:hypothetical protein